MTKRTSEFFGLPKTRLTGLSFILILVPLSFEVFGRIPIGPYHFRLTYFAAALALGTAFLHSPQKLILTLRRSKSAWLWGAMALPAAIATIWVSAYPWRSAAFGAWTAATLLLVPRLAGGFARIDFRVGRAFAIYLTFHSLLMTSDFLTCTWTSSHFTIGRKVFEGGLCRPHGFYLEPNYFASFGLVAWVALKFAADLDPSSQWRRGIGLIRWILALGMVCTTSRLAWAALPVLIGLEFALEYGARHRKAFAFATVVGLSGLLAIAVHSWKHPDSFLSSIARRSSFGVRAVISRASADVFAASPWVGVGPGSGGAFLAEHFPEHPLFVHGTPEDQRTSRQNYHYDHPLSVSLVMEILSEWGIIGFSLFVAGLLLFFGGVSTDRKLLLLSVFLIVSATWQTLPRFDLWFAFGLAAAWASAPPVRPRLK